MSMKKNIMMICAAFAFSVAAMAQNLDPTIEVSRVYEGKLIDVHKPAMEMAVPDTMHRFDLGFDYSVFENPYKGSYDFSPYILEMRPASSAASDKVFYLRAGAGYTLHPTLDVVWSPLQKGAFSVDVYGSHRSYIGEYRAVGGNPTFSGYDLLSKAGADLGYDWKKASLDFGASYNGIADKDYGRARSYNAVDAYATLKSKSSWPENFMYQVAFAYKYSQDNFSDLCGNDFKLDATFGPSFNHGGKVLFDLGVELDSYSGGLESTFGAFYLVPHYVYSKGVFKVDAGVRVSVLTDSEKGQLAKGQVVYPDVKMTVGVIPDAMRLYLNIGGGDKIQTYASILEKNHHADLTYGLAGPMSLVNASVERVSAVLGLAGRITSYFSYDVKGGYVNYGNAPLEAAYELSEGVYAPAIGYSSYQKWFAALDWNLCLQDFRFDGSLEFTKAWGIENEFMAAPSLLKGDVSALYDWHKRIYAGIDCEFATSRSSAAGFKMPGYADLGVYAEYVMNRKLSFWLRGGNLLNMEIQRNLLFAEKGINFTAGICLSF